jgi:flavin reductase (DIM6/NTAB) family NADH-FMN oxidoreductase RutF
VKERNVSEKVNVELANAYRLLHPMHTVLISTVGNAGKPNIMPAAWAMPTSINPPMVAISVSPQRHTHQLIEESKEFAINIPTVKIINQVSACGSTSGKEYDKFTENKLTPYPARGIKAPIVLECIAHIECKLRDKLITGDHTIFIGEIIEAYADKNKFAKAKNLRTTALLYHLGGNKFATLNPKIRKPKPTTTSS